MRSRRRPVHRFAVAMALIAIGAPAWAQANSAAPATMVTKPVPALLPLSVQFEITSANTGRTYKIYLSKPIVPPPPSGYAVLYVLDGDTAFPTAATQAVLASVLEGRKPVMVVGIGYPDAMAGIRLRTRDLTPYVPDAETAGKMPVKPEEWGGGDAFHKFMIEELRPVVAGMAAIDKSDQSLMGYSLGGLFALHILLSDPEAYKTYVIGSPSVYWNGKQVLRDLPSFTQKVRDGKVSPRILITSDELEQAPGSALPESYKMVDNARELAETLRKIPGTNGYRVDYASFAGETHNSGIPASTSRGVAFVEGAVPAAAQTAVNPADLGTAVAAQIGCASIFVSGRAEADVLRDDIHALAPFARTVALSTDRQHRTVTAAAPGATSRTALYRPAVGCTLLTGKTAIAALDQQAARLAPMKARDDAAVRLTPGGARHPVAIDRAALDMAVASAFEEQNKGGYPDTRAIVVVQHGAIVAERYAPGFGRNTRLLGWSATKSITAALVGLLVDDGVLKLDAPAPVPEWQGAGDPRAAITLRQLLNMSSGLGFNESYEPGSDALKMLFGAGDMGGYAASRPLQNAPGAKWSYSSGTTNILSGIVFRATGGTLDGVTRFARKHLFEPAGMRSALIEPDEAGVPVGSSYGYATARDWARFGQLFLDHGMAGGKRILSSDWVDFVRTTAPAAPRPLYGGQFWLNRGDDSGARKRMFVGLPADTFMALGHNEQTIAIIPSLDAVVVRLGWTPEGVSFDANKYLAAIAAALKPGAAAKSD